MALLHRAQLSPSKLEVVGDLLASRAWFRGGTLQAVGAYRFDDPEGEVGIETHLVRADDGPVLQVPLTYRAAPLPGGGGVAGRDHGALRAGPTLGVRRVWRPGLRRGTGRRAPRGGRPGRGVLRGRRASRAPAPDRGGGHDRHTRRGPRRRLRPAGRGHRRRPDRRHRRRGRAGGLPGARRRPRPPTGSTPSPAPGRAGPTRCCSPPPAGPDPVAPPDRRLSPIRPDHTRNRQTFLSYGSSSSVSSCSRACRA